MRARVKASGSRRTPGEGTHSAEHGTPPAVTMTRHSRAPAQSTAAGRPTSSTAMAAGGSGWAGTVGDCASRRTTIRPVPPTVSVVIPTRDRPAQLTAAVASALEQRGVDVEVVVVDDGSRGTAREVIAGLAGGPVRILRHEAPRGVSAARNAGIAAAAAPWIALLDDDDLWAPSKLAMQLEAA